MLRQRCSSDELFERAHNFLKPYKGYMNESQARELIHQAGVRTFPRPRGIPDNFRVQITEKGAGMLYVHPINEQISVRVMPGKPHSAMPHQRSPYVIAIKDGLALDKSGNLVFPESVEAHIPISEFIYQN